MIEFTGGAWYPERRTWAFGHPFVNATNPYPLGATFKRMGIVCVAPRTGTLTGYGVILGNVLDQLGGGLNSTFRFALQSVDPATALPDTTEAFVDLYIGNWPRATWYHADMVGTMSVTRGDLVACTLEWAYEHSTGSAAFWYCVQQPQNVQGPPWSVYWTVADGWYLGSGAPYMPLLVLTYDDGATAIEGPLPAAAIGRMVGVGTDAIAPTGMHFTVPRSLRCIGVNYNLRPKSDTTLTLYEDDIAIATSTVTGVGPSGGIGDYEFAFTEVLLRPGRAYRAELTSAGSFDIQGYRTVLGPAGSTGIITPDNTPDTWPALPGALDDFEGGPTWIAYGDDPTDYGASWGPHPPLVDRWIMNLHIPGPALELPVEPPPLLPIVPTVTDMDRVSLRVVGTYVP